MQEAHFGRIAIARVVDLDSVRFPADVIFPDASREIMQAEQRRLGPRLIDSASLDLLLSFHCFVLRTARHIILVDTCVGNDKERPMRPMWHRRQGAFLERLKAAGVTPEAVDFVLCTHLHADHVGWNTRLVDGRWVPTFPRARYLIAETEYQFWRRQYDSNPPAPVAYGSFADSVLPVAASGQAVMVRSDHAVETGIYLEAAPGHTPGNVIIHVEDGDAHAALCGDVLHHPVQLAHPAWSTRFCADPALSQATRAAFLRRYADTETRVLTGHFQAPTLGRIVRAGRAYDFIFDE